MKTMHTPGPWKVEADPEWKWKHPYHDARFITSGPHAINDDDEGPFINDPNCEIIAKMTDCQNQKANAQLISAAPDLLEACQAAVTWAETPGDHGGNPYLHQFVKLAQSAIAKATGGAK